MSIRDLHVADHIELQLVDDEVILEVVGEVGPRGIQGIEGEIGPIGPQGDVGPIGPEGPAGSSSGFFRWNQAAPSDQWVFTHDLKYPPAVTVVDSAGTVYFGDVTYVNDTTISIAFAFPFAGYAYCT
jgi:hypothetical protein